MYNLHFAAINILPFAILVHCVSDFVTGIVHLSWSWAEVKWAGWTCMRTMGCWKGKTPSIEEQKTVVAVYWSGVYLSWKVLSIHALRFAMHAFLILAAGSLHQSRRSAWPTTVSQRLVLDRTLGRKGWFQECSMGPKRVSFSFDSIWCCEARCRHGKSDMKKDYRAVFAGCFLAIVSPQRGEHVRSPPIRTRDCVHKDGLALACIFYKIE